MKQRVTKKKTADPPLVPAAGGSESVSYTLACANKAKMIAAFGQAGSVCGAARLAGISRITHYRWIREDATYADDFSGAVEEYADRVRDEITRRALDGALEVVLFKGQVSRDEMGAIVAVRRYSDRLLELLAKAKCAEFKDKVEHSGRLTLEQLLGGVD